METGVFDFTDEYYRSLEAVNVSSLKAMRKSYAHYLKELEARTKRIPAFDLGNAFHWKVLEPGKFDTGVAVKPRFTGTGSRKMAADWAKANDDKAHITESDHFNIGRMAAHLQKSKEWNMIMGNDHQIEQSIIWEDGIYGNQCKGKIDVIFKTGGDVHLVDLKSTLDASYTAFQASIANYGYFVQAAFYVDGYEAATGVRPKTFTFVAVEKADPWSVGVYTCSDAMLDFGMEVYRRLLNKLNHAVNDDAARYRGYQAKRIELPGFAKDKWSADCGLSS